MSNQELDRDSYLKEQKIWAANASVKKGTKVCVMEKATAKQGGWPDNWPSDMDALVGQTGTVTHPTDIAGVIVQFKNGDTYALPFFVLGTVDTEENGKT